MRAVRTVHDGPRRVLVSCRTFSWLAPDGSPVTVVACGPRVGVKPCRTCGFPSDRLCDYQLRGRLAGTTCNAPLCESCAVHVPPDHDLCPPHARLVKVAP